MKVYSKQNNIDNEFNCFACKIFQNQKNTEAIYYLLYVKTSHTLHFVQLLSCRTKITSVQQYKGMQNK